MSDAINGACRAMAEAASALRDLRLMASGDERFK